MKYLSTSLPPDDLKRIYRAFAKLLHPDAGGSHTEFILLQSEYETCQNSTFTAPPLKDNPFDVRMYQNLTMPFGKHKNALIRDVPKMYAQWCLDNIEALDYLLKKALLWRVQQET